MSALDERVKAACAELFEAQQKLKHAAIVLEQVNKLAKHVPQVKEVNAMALRMGMLISELQRELWT